ncbi:MAG TPA: DNA polymerase/3'-5' exonuclease PolX [Candidatus Limnocylindrales bacterium]|nr:DNA polymerase/3'-5' exonuclease PolX [Candidatus Limnocylindrales bacterium]
MPRATESGAATGREREGPLEDRPATPDPEQPPFDERPRASRGDDVPLLSNGELARLFYEIGDMMELKGELPFKALAYRRAADSIAHATVDVALGYREGRPPRLPGVGKAIDEKLAELADTGRLRFYERLRQELPPTLVDLLAVPGIGPRTVRLVHEQLGVTTLRELEEAARAGRLRTVRGMTARTEEKVLAGLDALERKPARLRLGQAAELIERTIRALIGTRGLRGVIPAGSFRRRRETIGDLDLLAETDDPVRLLERFAALPSVARVVAHGGHKATVRLVRGPQVDLMVMPPDRAGTYLVHFTGSAAHNVRLREIARDLGWTLSEHGFQRLGPSGQPLAGDESELRTFAEEEGVYAFLGLPFIPPELREDRGEIEAARAGRLPDLIALEEIVGDCHTHSDWSDGAVSIERMARTGRARGYAYQVLTDHTISLSIANGLDPQRFEEQRRIVGELNESFAREEALGRIPPGAHPDGFRLLHGCELEVRADGRLDFDERFLAGFDVVVASVHVGRRQPREQLMARTLTALRSPHVDILAHPSGRKLGIRADLDLDWEAVYAEAARTGTLLEINGSDERLDLDDRRARAARDAGCRLVIDSDAHYLREFDNIGWGVAVARRGWITATDVANTLPRDAFLDWVGEKPARVA